MVVGWLEMFELTGQVERVPVHHVGGPSQWSYRGGARFSLPCRVCQVHQAVPFDDGDGYLWARCASCGVRQFWHRPVDMA